jgi:hypothetical protein
VTRHIQFLTALCATALLLSACSDNSAPALPSAQGAATVVSTGEAVLQPAQPAAATAVIADNAPNASSTACPPLAKPPIPAKPAAFNQTAQAIAAYLTQGASIEEVSAAMQAWGVKFAAPGTNEALGSIEFAKILTGDDPQLVATFFDPTQTQEVSRFGDLAVFTCANGQYQIAYQALSDPAFEGIITDPRVLSVEDVSGDGLFDLSFLTGDCRAGTCLDGVTVLSVHGNAALRNLAPEIPYAPYPSFEYVPAANGSAARDLMVIEGILGDSSAGPQRSVTNTWAFNGQNYTLAGTVREPILYRIHALHDGDDALRAKDFGQADALFTRVTSDVSLQPWDGNPNVAQEPQTLSAFAFVRLMQSAAIRGDVTGVNAARDSLNRAAATDSAASPFAQLGEAYFAAWTNGNNHAAGCAAAIAFGQQNKQVYEALGINAFGTANYDYQPEDMCIQ